MIPLVFGLLFRKFNARGALWGVLAGSITGVVLVLTNFFLIQAYAEQMKVNSTLEFWLRSGWNSAATVPERDGHDSGDVARYGFKDRRPTDEKERVTEFFRDLKKAVPISRKKRQKPCRPSGSSG